MRNAWKAFVNLLFVLALMSPSRSAEASDDSPSNNRSSQNVAAFKKTVAPFLTKYCVSCHGVKKPKGDRQFHKLSGVIKSDNDLVDLQDVLDQLNLGEMPPQTAKQPPNTERRRVVAWLTNTIKQFHASQKGQGRGTVLRRLNSREYNNSIRDLLKLNMTMFNPSEAFPRDQTTEHFDNNGQALVTSGYLLARYLDAAEQVVTKAVGPMQKPTPQTWTFRDNFRQQPEIDQVFRKVGKFTYMTLFDVIGADKHEGAYGPILAFKDGVPHDGFYEIRLRAEALNRLHPYDPAFLGTDRSEPLRLGIRPGNIQLGALHKPQPIEPLLTEFELADEPKWYTVRVWLDAGYTPRFTFQNGLMDARNIWGKLVSKYADQFPKRTSRGIVENRLYSIKYGKLPQIRIHEIEIKGPFYDRWPTASQVAVFGDTVEDIQRRKKLSPATMRSQIEAFASRAYRRPATPLEVDRVMRVIESRQAAGRNSIEAFADGLKAILCSPSFLFLDESLVANNGNEQPESKLAAYHLAARLSYFLWSSTPDSRLLHLAKSGELTQASVLHDEVERMLDDKKSAAFIEGFLGTWLTLRELGSTPPDRSQFRSFYHFDLGSAMRRETQLFTQYLLEENLSVANFLDSDFTFVNKPLAKMYGLEPVAGFGFHKVSLPDRRRGGLLGQASVLTVTANGIDTSPVVRGVWLLENVLGTPPSPPPPDVEPLDPDTRGAKTIRDQLQKHRSVASCFDCHRSIDPMGFALENFDPIGRWRTSYGRNKKVDASGELPTGESFKTIGEFKQIMVQRKNQFTLSLAKKLLSYATGRHVTPLDRPHLDRIVTTISKKKYGFRDLIHEIVKSDPFQCE